MPVSCQIRYRNAKGRNDKKGIKIGKIPGSSVVEKRNGGKNDDPGDYFDPELFHFNLPSNLVMACWQVTHGWSDHWPSLFPSSCWWIESLHESSAWKLVVSVFPSYYKYQLGWNCNFKFSTCSNSQMVEEIGIQESFLESRKSKTLFGCLINCFFQ